MPVVRAAQVSSGRSSAGQRKPRSTLEPAKLITTGPSPKPTSQKMIFLKEGRKGIPTVESHKKEIDNLVKSQKDLWKERNYDQGEIVYHHTLETSLDAHEIRKETLKQHEDNEMQEMLNTCDNEIAEFDAVWDKRDEEFEENAAYLTTSLQDDNKIQYASYMRKIRETTLPTSPHWSPECLRLMKMHDDLGKQRRFAEAKSVKDDADRLQKEDEEAWRTAREAKIQVLEEQFLEQQQREYSRHVERLHGARDTHDKQRRAEFSALLHRHEVVKAQLKKFHTHSANIETGRHGLEKGRLESASTSAASSMEVTPRGRKLQNEPLPLLTPGQMTSPQFAGEGVPLAEKPPAEEDQGPGLPNDQAEEMS